MDHLCYFCLVFVMLSRVYLLMPCDRFVKSNFVFVTFPCGILVQVWYLIVSIPDICPLSYFS